MTPSQTTNGPTTQSITTTTTEAVAVVEEETEIEGSFIATIQLSERFAEQLSQADGDGGEQLEQQETPSQTAIEPAGAEERATTHEGPGVSDNSNNNIINNYNDDNDDDDNDGKPDTVIAEPVVSQSVINIDHELYGGFSTRMLDFSAQKAEFVSVTFHKATKDVALGIHLSRDEVRISSIAPHSMASNSPLQVGDAILSVNNKVCNNGKLNSEQVGQILRNSGSVFIVVHNPQGRSNLVESMVIKSDKNEILGLGLTVDASHNLVVSSIKRDKKFYESLLNPGDFILSINGTACSHLEPDAARDIIQQSPQFVTILARTFRETGVVVAEISERHLTHASSVPYLVTDGDGRHRRRPQTAEEVDTDACCILL